MLYRPQQATGKVLFCQDVGYFNRIKDLGQFKFRNVLLITSSKQEATSFPSRNMGYTRLIIKLITKHIARNHVILSRYPMIL